MGIPHVLLAFHSRPMSAGVPFREGFRQAGCRVTVAGPGTPTVYGKPSGGEHTFEEGDYVPPNIQTENAILDVQSVIDFAAQQPCGKPDLVVMVDQADRDFCLTGKADVPFVYIAVENWQPLYAQRYAQMQPDHVYYMIRHLADGVVPLPERAQWLPFGCDPYMHPYRADIARTRTVVQIGSPYDPRPAIWNYLRAQLDVAPPVTPAQYAEAAYATEHTIFGRIPSYRGFAVAHNECKVALSSSNVDFSPMRIMEALAMGCVLVSDDVPAIRALLGPPLQEQPHGIWSRHDRTPEGTLRAVKDAEAAWAQIAPQGLLLALTQHTYRHRALAILQTVGLQGICRVV